MRLTSLLERETKDNRPITFERYADCEGDNNRGWTVDKLVALIDGQEVGYLKMSYIPKSRFDQYYKNVFSYMSHITGYSFMPSEKKSFTPEELTNDELVDFLYQLPAYHNRGYGDKSQLQKLSRAELLTGIKKLENEHMAGKMGERFKQFQAYHVNKPIVDFIRVGKEFRRQGIGHALYQEGAKWMKELGMRLHASTLQSDEAKAAWLAMEKKSMVGRDRQRRRFVRV